MKQEPGKIKYFEYPRKSSEQEDRQVASIDSQKSELGELAKREGLNIIEILEESHSAKYPGRPIFNKMVERIEQGEANGLLVWNPSRISRNSVDTGKIVYLFDIGKLHEVRTPGQTFRNTPNDKFLLNLFCSQAKLENDNKGEDVKRGLRAKVQAGIYPAPAPVGYTNDKYAERGTKTILVDQERFDTVRRMFDMMLTGNYTVPKIVEIANEEWKFKMPPTKKRPAGKEMSRNTLYHVFSSPFYYGSFEYPSGSGIWIKGIHKPMITEDEYDTIQVLLGRKGRPRPKSHIFEFTGMIRCVECKSMITAEEKFKHQQNGNVHHYIYYHCTRKKNPNCTQAFVEVKELRNQIKEAIESLRIPPEFHTFAMKWFRQQNEKEAGSRNAVLTTQRKGYDLCLKKIDGLIDMRAAGMIGDNEFNLKMVSLKKEKSQLEELLNDTGDRVNKWLNVADEMCVFVQDAVEKFNTGNLWVRKGILQTLGQNLVLKDKILQIDLENSLMPMETVSKEVCKIHKRLEPRKTVVNQMELERLYSKSPRLLRG
ncbi:MAG: recombinase family protein [Minisyncoccia bacterium]